MHDRGMDDEQAAGARQPCTRCTYCEREAFAPEIIRPAMCEKHHEVALMVSRLRRNERPVTLATVRTMHSALVRPFITDGELPRLLSDIMMRGVDNVDPHSAG